MIDLFKEQPVDFGNIVFPTAQHAYEAAKSEDPHEWLFISKISTAYAAKYYGEHCLVIRPDWDEIKENALAEILEIRSGKYAGTEA